MPIAFHAAAFNLVTALSCGAVIGMERQVRQRMAGLRTNALVALGACGFVTFSELLDVSDTSPSRVAAQVVSGIGFLGAGIIFRDGFEIHGINTAATLWCSASVGLLSATGHVEFALLMTALVVFVNLGLRPFVKLLKRYTAAGQPAQRSWSLHLDCRSETEGQMRALILRNLALAGLHLQEIRSDAADGGVTLTALVAAEGAGDVALEQLAQRLAAEPGILRLRWSAAEEG